MEDERRTYHIRATQLPEGDEVDLWVVDGRLSFRSRDGAEELAPPGGFALPGLVDCHAHLTMNFARKPISPGSRELVEANLTDHARSGTLLVRDIGAVSDATAGLFPRGDLARVQRAGLFLAPPGGYFDGLLLRPAPEDLLVHEAAEQIRSGAEWVKVIGDWQSGGALVPNYSQTALKETVDAAHALGGRVAVHLASREAAADSIAAGVDTIEHGFGLDEDLLRAMAAQGIAWTPTVAMLKGMQETRGAGMPPGLAEAFEPAAESFRWLLPRAPGIGVTVLAGTDMLPSGSIASEVAALQEFGLEPAVALAAATTTAREFLGEPALEEGAPADLIVYQADPREHPEVLARPTQVLLGGRRIA